MARGRAALAIGLIVITASCAPGPGLGSPATQETGGSVPAATEAPPPAVSASGYVDRDAVIEFDGDDDGTNELMYQFDEYTTPEGLTVEQWVDVEPAEGAVNGRLWFVLENETEGPIPDATVAFEIPKSLVPEVDDDSFSVTDAPPGTVEITVTDPDPRFEVRVVEFAGGLRPTIRTTIDPELVAIGAKAILGGDARADLEGYAAGRVIDTAMQVINMTGRDFAFLRKARECATIEEGDWGARQLCAGEMIAEFPDKFSEADCDDIVAIHPETLFSLAGCRAAVANDPASCDTAPDKGTCLRWVAVGAANRCAALDGYPGATDRCTAGIGPWLADYCAASDWSGDCCATLTALGHTCDGGDDDGEAPDSKPPFDPATYPIRDWFTSSLSACEAFGAALPGRALEDHDAVGSETEVYGTDYADVLVSEWVECLFRDPDAWYQSTKIAVTCWPTEADADFVWNGDYGGGSISGQYCGEDPGVSNDWTVDCAGDDHITIDEGCGSVGDDEWCSASVQYRDRNCSVRIAHHTGPATDPVAAGVALEPTINAYLDSLR